MLWLRPRPRLVGVDHELVARRAADDFVRRGDDGVGEARGEAPRFAMRERRRLLDPDVREDERLERQESTDREVAHGAQRLHTVVRIGRHFQRA